MNYGDVYLNTLLEQYQNQLKEQKKELKNMPEGNLFMRKQGSSRQYMQELQIENKNRPLRKGITRNQDVIDKLARKKYLEISNELLIDEIRMLEIFLRNHTEPSANNTLNRLPKAYSELPETSFSLERERQMPGQRLRLSKTRLI